MESTLTQANSISAVARISRIIYLSLNVLFGGIILLQGYSIGLMLFGGPPMATELHIHVGWYSILIPFFNTIFLFTGKLHKQLGWLHLAVFADNMLQLLLVSAFHDMPFATAFHPANAIVLFALNVTIIVRTGKAIKQA